MKRSFTIVIIAIFISACSSTKNYSNLNRIYKSERFDLEVREYLDKDGLFTLVLEDIDKQALGKVGVYVVMENIKSGKAYKRKLYSFNDPVGYTGTSRMIEDNYLTLDEDGNYKILNQGKNYGYSSEEKVVFFSNQLEQGEYNFQVIFKINNGEKIYSNIIEVNLPIEKLFQLD